MLNFWQNQNFKIFGSLIILSAFISGCEVNQLTSSNKESKLSNKLESIDPADSDQIKQIIKQELVTFLKEKQDMKYQFLCDENERWIYRCNRMTGEIECFSMSSNKLRLLSSTR